MAARVQVEGHNEIAFYPGTTWPIAAPKDGQELSIVMNPDAAEELAHHLLLCAKSARGYPITEFDKHLVKRWTVPV